MKSFKLKKFKLLSLVISVITIMFLSVMSVNALDLTYSGGGSTESANSIYGSTKYSLVTTNGYQPIIAYRFSVLRNDKTTPADATRVDIYNDSWIKYYVTDDKGKFVRYKTYEELYGVRGQYNKQQWIGGGTFNNNYTVNWRGFARAASSGVGDGGMPHDPTEMKNWLMKKDSNGRYANALAVFKLCGFDREEQIKNDYYLVIEPVIQCQVDGKYTAATDVELAVCGGKTYGYKTEGRGADTAYDGTFKFISFRVCNQLAQYMRINGSPNLWTNAPYLNTVYKDNGKPNLTSSDSAAYYKVIEWAYAVNLVKATDVVKQVTVNIYPNGSVYTYGGVKYDKTKCTFTVPAGSQISLPEAKRIYWHNPEWRIYKQGSNNMADYKSAKTGGTITVNENIDIVPYYSEKKVRYNVNGGKAEESATWRSGSDDLIMKNNAVFETKPVVSMMTDYRDSSGYWQWIENKDTTPFKLSRTSTPPLGSCQSRHIEKNVKSTP